MLLFELKESQVLEVIFSSCCVVGYGKRRRNAAEEVPTSEEERLVSLISKLGGQVRGAAPAST